MSTDDRILDAALRVFSEVGFRAATTRRIALDAGVNEVTLFRRFGSKERLLMAALGRTEESAATVDLPDEPVDPAGELCAWARVHVRRMVTMRGVIRSAMCETDAHPGACRQTSHGRMRIHGQLRAYLRRLRDRGLAHGDWDDAVAASLLMGALFAEVMAQDAMPARHDFSAEDVADHYVRLFVRAIGASS